MELTDFMKFLKSKSPTTIAEELIFKTSVHAFNSEQDYQEYKSMMIKDHPAAYHVAIVGSANWKFSLNPTKGFREFNVRSDIDIAIICADSYLKTWDALRRHHRESYYTLDKEGRDSLRRNGENVYSGFASPKWIPSLTSELKQRYQKLTNVYSNRAVNYKTVNMMYFRDVDETIDYYIRGIRTATR
jgi:hypothetical protein